MNQTPPTKQEIPEDVRAGQAIYTPGLLSIYDLFVLGFSNRFVWKSSTLAVLNVYDRLITGNHLEVGVGTGYFLDHCRFPVADPRVVLLDLNPNCLQSTARRIARYSPQMVQANVLEPIQGIGEPFDSIGVNYVLHCLPGTMASKGVVFDHLRALLKPGGVLFGSTLLSVGPERGFLARRLAAFYNRRGVFSNQDDRLEELREALESRFSECRITQNGCAAIFEAKADGESATKGRRG